MATVPAYATQFSQHTLSPTQPAKKFARQRALSGSPAKKFAQQRVPSRSRPPSDRAGRTFSRTGSCDVATLKPMTPLQPLMQTNVKPPSPMLAPKQRPLKPPSPLRPLMQANVKPPSPLQPKNAPKTPISHPQRRCRFQLGLGLREQRRRRFHARDFQCLRAMAEPDRTTSRRTEPHISDQAPPVWRAPEGPEGTGGLRDRPLRAVRLACGDLAGGPPPTGTHSGRAPQPGPPAPGTPAAPCCGDGGNRTPVPTRRPEHQGSNKQPSNARAPARHSKRGRHQPTPCASALTHP